MAVWDAITVKVLLCKGSGIFSKRWSSIRFAFKLYKDESAGKLSRLKFNIKIYQSCCKIYFVIFFLFILLICSASFYVNRLNYFSTAHDKCLHLLSWYFDFLLYSIVLFYPILFCSLWFRDVRYTSHTGIRQCPYSLISKI